MRGRTIPLGVCILFCFTVFYLTEVTFDVFEDVSGSTIYVNTTGSNGAYMSIQDAINAAGDGETVFVYSGTYYERLNLNKPVHLIGEDRDATVIDGGGSDDTVIIKSNWVNITGFNITGSGWSPGNAGIKLNNAIFCRIFNNTIQSNEDGIHLNVSGENDITGNIINNNFGRGIYLNSSHSNNISKNTARANRYGIYLDFSNFNDIEENTVYWNTIHGIYISFSNENNVTANEVFLNAQHGIVVTLSDGNTIARNNASSNDIGVYLDRSNGNEIRGNDVSLNIVYGLSLSDSLSNWIYHNNIIDNTDQAYDNSNSNTWNDTYPSGGNYWSNYNGLDENRGFNQDISGSDGIGDVDYEIDSDSIDHFPLMKPYPDLNAPRIQLISPQNKSIVQPGVTLDFNISDDNLDFANYSINGNPPDPFSKPFDIITDDWDDGGYSIKICAMDFAGNSNSTWFFFEIDSISPGIKLTNPTNNSVIPNGTILDFSIMDVSPIQANYSLDGILYPQLSEPYNISTSGWPDEDYHVRIIAVDDANNTNSSSFFFKLDSTKPQIVMNYFDNNSVVPNGTVLDFDILDDNLLQANYSIDGEDDEPFPFPYNISLAGKMDGKYNIQINAVDQAKNRNSSIYSITLDSKKPNILLNGPENNSFIPYGTILDLAVSDANLMSVNYSKNNGTSVPLSGNHDISTLGWEDGSLHIQINTVDSAGNTNTSWFFFILDTLATRIILNSPENNSAHTEIDSINFTVDDTNLVHVNYSINHGDNYSISEPYDILATEWDDDEYFIQFNALDKAGNTNSSWFMIIIDSIKPLITLATPENNSILTELDVFSFYVNDSNLQSVNYSIDKSRNISISGSYDLSDVDWGDGYHEIKVNALDLAGNANSACFSFVIDSHKPFVELNSPNNNSIIPAGEILKFDILDMNLMHANYSIDDGDIISISEPYNIFTEGLEDGEFIVQINALDRAGNYNSSSFSFVIDSTEPQIVLCTPKNDSIVTAGTILTFDITDPHLVYVNRSINGETAVSFLEPFNISTMDWSDGYYEVQINALDLTGNLNSSSFFLTLDSLTPHLWFDPTINHSTMPFGGAIELEVSDLHLERVQYSIDGGDSFRLSSPFIITTAGWPDGPHNVEVKAWDEAGNEVIRTFDVTIDAIFPYVVSNYIMDQPRDNGIDYTIVVTFNEPINQTEIEDHVEIFPFENYNCDWNFDRTVLSVHFSSDEPDQEATYWMKIEGGISDLNGNPMLSDFELVFSTEAQQQLSETERSSSEPSFSYWIFFVIAFIIAAIATSFFILERRRVEVLEEKVRVAAVGPSGISTAPHKASVSGDAYARKQYPAARPLYRAVKSMPAAHKPIVRNRRPIPAKKARPVKKTPSMVKFSKKPLPKGKPALKKAQGKPLPKRKIVVEPTVVAAEPQERVRTTPPRKTKKLAKRAQPSEETLTEVQPREKKTPVKRKPLRKKPVKRESSTKDQ